MADNTTLNAGTGGDTIASDDIGGVKFQRVKPALGADGTAVDSIPVSNGLDTTATGVQAVGIVGQFDDVATGAVTENQFAPVRISTRRALLVEGVASGTVIPISDGAGSLTVDGTVATSNFPSTVDTNSGNKSASTLRVVLATDQPALTNKLLVTPDSVALPANQSVNIAQLAATTTDTNSGNKSAGTLRVVLATDQPALTNKLLVTPDAVTHDVGTITTAVVPGTGATNLGKAEDAAHTTGDVGVMALAVRAAAPTERSAGPTDGDYEPLAVNEVGAVWSTLTPSANGGLTTFMASGSDGSNILVATSQVIKASAGVLYGYYAFNPEAAVTFVHFYNTASASVTVGTTNPLFTIAIPAGSAANLALPYGITFSNAGWSCAATTTAGGNTAPATGVSLVAWYK